MFQTYGNAKIDIPWSLPDEFVWSYAELLNIRPWIFADCKVCYEEGSLRQIFFLSLPAQVLNLFGNNDVIIDDLYLITPDTINKSGRWNMSLIMEIYIGSYHSDGNNIEVTAYNLENNQRIVSVPEIGDLNDLDGLKIIYRKNT